MADPLAWAWQELRIAPVTPARDCGCFHDPVVFGHYHVLAEGAVSRG